MSCENRDELYRGVNMHGIKWCGFLPACLAIALSIALVVAMQYCTLESLTQHSAQGSHRPESEGPCHEGDLPPGKAPETLCCFALQAIDTSPPVVHQIRPSAIGIVHSFVFDAPRIEIASWQARVTNGLSPPAREPTPHTFFFRAVFASHAPPLYLA